jgi:hypothetical protein
MSTVTHVLSEGPFNMDALKAIVFTPKTTTPEKVVSMCQSIYLILMNNDEQPCNSIPVRYGSPESGFGNEIHRTPSIQLMKIEYRILVLQKGAVFDIDMVASGIQIMHQVVMRLGIDCKFTKQYLDNREHVLSMISKDRSKDKTTIDAIFNGGYFDPSNYGRGLNELFEEFKRNRKTFYELGELLPEPYVSIRKGMFLDEKFLKKTQSQKEGSFVSRVKDDLQSKCLSAMVTFIGAEKVSTLINDGLLSRIMPDLRACETFVFEQTGFRIHLKNKPFELTQEQIDEMLPSLNETGVDWGNIPIFNHSLESMPTYEGRNGETKRCLPEIKFKKDVKCMAFDAAMGIGKTHANKVHINNLRKELGREPRVIIVSCRRLQARDVYAAYKKETLPELQYYKGMGWDALHNATQLVIQYESLYKLKGLTTPYDAFVFDEPKGEV